MIYLRNTTDFKFNNTCVTIGKFDGLHLGHQLLIDTIRACEKEGLTSVMLSLDILPGTFDGNVPQQRIYTEAERVEMLEKKGPQIMISYPFTRETLSTEAEVFLKEVLIDRLGAKVIVMGDDFCFGKNRLGDAGFLTARAELYGYRTVVCPRIMYKGEVVSSTLIRARLAEGDRAGAAELLNPGYFGKEST